MRNMAAVTLRFHQQPTYSMQMQSQASGFGTTDKTTGKEKDASRHSICIQKTFIDKALASSGRQSCSTLRQPLPAP